MSLPSELWDFRATACYKHRAPAGGSDLQRLRIPQNFGSRHVTQLKPTAGGGDPIELDQGEAGWLKYIAVDSKQLYFTDISRVYALPK